MNAKCLAAIPFLICLLGAKGALCQTNETAGDAGAHFRHGVELYEEANYSGALVEFKRAYALSPTSAALYDIGEAQFQLQFYADALKTFRRFLTDYGPNENHRASVESGVQVLASRVGVLRVTTVPAGADVAVDDETVGKTPLDEPVLVSVGHRKLVASMRGRPSVTRYIDVAAGDDVPISLSLSAPEIPPAETPSSALAPPPPVTVHTETSPALRTGGWIATGALAAGALVFGALAVGESNSLSEARDGLTTSTTLNHDANLTMTFSVLADSLAAASIIAGGLSLYWTLSSSGDHNRAAAATSRLTIGAASALFETKF